MAAQPDKASAPDEEKPPVFSTWSGWYALVIGTLAALVILFTLVSRHYR